MMHNRIVKNQLMPALTLGLALVGTSDAALVANRTVLSAGDRLQVISVNGSDARGDLHIGFMKGQGTPLFDADDQGLPTPVFMDVPLDQPQVIAEFDIPPGVAPGLYILYEIVTRPGGDPNNLQDWALGLSSLNQLALYLNVPAEVSGDRDGNGRPDDDADGDGFRNADRNRDGLPETSDTTGAGRPAVDGNVPISSELRFINTGVFPAASGKLRYRTRDDGRVDFKVQAEDLPLGPYELLVNGSQVATLNVVNTVKGPEGELEFRRPSEPGKLPLDFAPIGATIQIADGGNVVLTQDFTASVVADNGNGGGDGVPEVPVDVPPDASEIEVPLLNAGIQGAASGKVRHRVRDDREDFKVQIEDLPLGSYRLLVDGTQRGTIQVANTADGIEGEIEFRDPVEPGKQLLNFTVRGAAVEILDGQGQVLLSVRVPG